MSALIHPPEASVHEHGSVGAHREVAEAQAAYLLAQRFPRDEAHALEAIKVAFQRPSLAERASYEYARGGTRIEGPSAAAAAAMARAWGNISAGWRETARGIGPSGIPFSDIVAFAEDLQTRTRRGIGFVCEHVIDTRDGPRALRDEREAYELCANQASRRVRACILALLPEDVIDAAMEQASATVKARADVTPEGVAKMVAAFVEVGVTRSMIERRLQRPLASITAAQVLGLRRIYASLRDGVAIASDFFTPDPPPPAGAAIDPESGEIAPPAPPPPPRRGTTRPKSGTEAPKPETLSQAGEPSVEDLLEEIARTSDSATLDALADVARSLAAAGRERVLAALTERVTALASKESPGEQNPTGASQG